MELKDLEFITNEYQEEEAFIKVTDDIELQITREQDLDVYKYDCILWNNSCARSISLGYDIGGDEVENIIILFTH
ncbi:MAG: hypothetical protein WCR54_08865 [Clostridia bacterium]